MALALQLQGLSLITLDTILLLIRKAVFIITGGRTQRRKTSGEVPFTHLEWISYLLFAFVPKPEAVLTGKLPFSGAHPQVL